MIGPFRGKGSKDVMIKDAESQCQEFLTDEQYDYLKDGKTYTSHQFIHYKDWSEYVKTHQNKNRHAFEVINSECKLYFDIEYYKDTISTPTPTNLFWYDIIPSLQKHYEAYYGMSLNYNDLCISSTKPRPSKETTKWSFHIVVSNGYFIKQNKDIKNFIKYLKSNETNQDIVNAIDDAPYQSKQSFKLPYQSKIDAPEYIQNIIKGDFKNHLIKRYKHDEFKGYYQCIIKQETIENFTQKNIQPTEPTTLEVGKIISEVETAYKGSLKDPLNDKLKKLGNDNLNWQTYFAVMCAIKNVYPDIHGKQMFMDWAKLSSKFVESTSHKEWDGLIPRNNGRTIKTIDDLLKKKYPNEYQDENVFVNSITEITLNLKERGYDTKTVNSRYCSDVINLYELMGFKEKRMFEVREKTYTDIVIKSHLGTGKSTIIEKLFEKKQFDSVLVVSPRVMFGNKIFSDFSKYENRFKFYKDIKKEERDKEKFIVCQLESVSTLGCEYELVVLDEVESIFNQFHSSTMVKNHDKISAKFAGIMNHAKYVISADAFITNRSVDVLASMRPKKHKIYIENTLNPYKRTSLYMGNNADKLTKCIMNDVEKNKNDKRVIVTGSRPHCDTIHDTIRDTGQTCLKINRFTDDKLTQEIRKVDAMWSKYQNVVYTSTITVGVSYDPKVDNLKFDSLFMNFSVNGACVRDMFQSSLRARVIKKNKLFYTVYDRFMRMDDSDDIVLLRTFEELYEWKMRNVDNKLPEWIVKVWAYNELEKVINRLYFKKVIDKYLLMCGYTSYLLPIEKVSVSNEIKKQGLFELDEVEFDYEECDEIYKKLCSGEAKTEDKLKYLKYDFKVNLIGVDCGLDGDTLKDMFRYFQQNPTYIHRVLDGFLVENEKYEGVSPYTENIRDMKTFVDGLNEVLGIENAYTETVIKRNNLMKVKDYFEAHLEDMKKLFMFNTHKKFDVDTEKALMGTLNTIYNGYIGMGFKFGERKRKRIDGGVVDMTPIIMLPYQIIEKKKVVFDMAGFNSAFKKKIYQQGYDDHFPTEYMLRDIPEDEI